MSLVAVITGASSGIGAAAARRLAREPGARLVLVARREQRLRELTDELGDGITYVAADVTDADAPARIRAHVEEHHGRLTLLVNNAGASQRATFADGGYVNVRETMDLNFDSVVRLTEALLPLLRASPPSAIVNVASTAARVARAGAGAYSASKFRSPAGPTRCTSRNAQVASTSASSSPASSPPTAFPPPSCGPSRGRAGWSPTPAPPPRR
jgi:uncharacterized protein